VVTRSKPEMRVLPSGQDGLVDTALLLDAISLRLSLQGREVGSSLIMVIF